MLFASRLRFRNLCCEGRSTNSGKNLRREQKRVVTALISSLMLAFPRPSSIRLPQPDASTRVYGLLGGLVGGGGQLPPSTQDAGVLFGTTHLQPGPAADLSIDDIAQNYGWDSTTHQPIVKKSV